MKERPSGSISVAGEMAATTGEDPRPYLTAEEIEEIDELLRISCVTLEQWNDEFKAFRPSFLVHTCVGGCFF